ncbi:MAG: hypothetical protein JSU73_13800 [candidate division WOR-3 bacterium]|nr:MAG: hypothetical protein JSU73_13800 [candidate division WOR-3 bacterium]
MAVVKTTLCLGAMVCIALAGTGMLSGADPGIEVMPGKSPSQTVTIWAGQHYNVGSVVVRHSATQLYVIIALKDNWLMSASHLAVANSPEELPRNSLGELVPGQFPYGTAHDPTVAEFLYTVPLRGLRPDDTLAVAVHVVVNNGQQTESGWGRQRKGWFPHIIPSSVHDVAAVEILCPVDTVFLDSAYTPTAVIREEGGMTSIFPVTMKIGTLYSETKTCTLAPTQTDTIEFSPDWTARPVGTHATVCYTALAKDVYRANDTVYGEVTVVEPEYHDVGAVEILAPVGTVDSGTVHTPRAVITNHGNQAETFPVTFEIGSIYSETITRSLAVGETDTVDFPDWTALQIGGFGTMCYTALTGDQDRSNDTVWSEVSVERPGSHDVGAVRIYSPPYTSYLDSTYTPSALIRNFGDFTDTFPVVFMITAGYADTIAAVTLDPGDSTVVSFADWTPDTTGFFYSYCYTVLDVDEDRSNDTARRYVRVIPTPYHDVGVLEILVPPDTVDSGSVHTPEAVVHNFGNSYEFFPVIIEIGTGYRDSTQAYLPPGRTDTVEFTLDWTAEPNGNHAMMCYSTLATDQNRSNDTAYDNVYVRPPDKDVGVVSILAPRDTVDSGTVITPMAVVHRFMDFDLASDLGTDVAFPVVMNIGGTYSDTVQVTMPTQGSVTVTFNETWVAEPIGTIPCTCYTVLDVDSDRSNDTAYGAVVVVEPAHHDVGALAILVPTDTVDSGSVHTPLAVIRNYGNRAETFEVFFSVGDRYTSSTLASLGVGQTDTIAFQPDWAASELGTYACTCYTDLAADEDRSNDTAFGSVVVEPGEPPQPPDVGAIAILAPVGTVEQGADIRPRAIVLRFADYGFDAATGGDPGSADLPDLTFWVTMMIGSDYVDSLEVTLGTNIIDTVEFANWTADPLGRLATVCFTQLWNDANRSNDTAYGEVEVTAGPYLDVGAVAILAPGGTVDSGSVHTPSATVTNYGNRPATFPVTFEITDGYAQTVGNVTLNPNDTVTVNFPYWTASQPGDYSCVCYTSLSFDEDRSNDTAFGAVRVDTLDARHDVGAFAILAPLGTLDSGTVHTPRARVTNYGNRTETFPVTFEIGTVYADTFPSVTLAPGDTATLRFASWVAQPVGKHPVVCYTMLDTDQNRRNDTVMGNVSGRRDSIEVIPVTRHNVATIEILVPVGKVELGSIHTPAAVVENRGNRTETFPVTFEIGTEYAETFEHTLMPSQVDTVIFPYWSAAPAGILPTRCYTSLETDADRSDDSAYGEVEVILLPDVGAEVILAPTGQAVITGAPWKASISPSARIRNYYHFAEPDVEVRFRIELMRIVFTGERPDTDFVSVYETTTAASLEPSASLVVSFPDSVLDFGVYTVTCWTMLDTDTDHSNDSCSASFVVQGPAPAGASRIRIYTRAGEFIRDLAVPEGPVRPPWVNWDGKNHNGQLVAKGKYLCLLLDAGDEVITSYNALVPEQGQAVRLSTSRD